MQFDAARGRLKHVDAVCALSGVELLFGGEPLTGHSIPSIYGAYKPTAVKVPLKHFKAQAALTILREGDGITVVPLRYYGTVLPIILLSPLTRAISPPQLGAERKDCRGAHDARCSRRAAENVVLCYGSG